MWEGRNRTKDVAGPNVTPIDPQPWDYWKIGEIENPEPTNHTGLSYGVCVPKHKDGSAPGFVIAALTLHTIEENEDGTITVMPGSWGTNSIPLGDFHGWINHGVWTEDHGGRL